MPAAYEIARQVMQTKTTLDDQLKVVLSKQPLLSYFEQHSTTVYRRRSSCQCPLHDYLQAFFPDMAMNIRSRTIDMQVRVSGLGPFYFYPPVKITMLIANIDRWPDPLDDVPMDDAHYKTITGADVAQLIRTTWGDPGLWEVVLEEEGKNPMLTTVPLAQDATTAHA